MDRKKQEEKNRQLEQEVNQRKKNLTGIHSKLDEYVKAYPDFKPKKKAEPVQPSKKDAKSKKSVSIVEDDKSDRSEEVKKKKKKNNKAPQYEDKTEAVDVIAPKIENKPSKDKKKKGLKNKPE